MTLPVRPPGRLAVALAVATVVILVLFAADGSAATTKPSTDGRYSVSVVPLKRSQTPPPYFTLALSPGSTTHRQVLVENGSNKTMSFYVSPVDGLTGTTTGSVYANRQDRVYKAGRWVTPDVASLTVPRHSSRKVGFAVTVPANEPAGQYLAGLAVENAAKTTTGQKGFQIKQILRTVVGVFVKVPGKTAFVPALTGLNITNLAGPNVASVKVSLGNVGTQIAKPDLTIALVGPDGYHRTLTRHLDTILTGDRIVYPYAWPDELKSGSYDVTATYGTKAASLTLHRVIQLGKTLPGTTTKPPAAAPGGGNSTPWILIGAVLVAGLGGGLLLRRRPPRAGSPA